MAIERDDRQQAKSVSRRGFLSGLGAGAAGAAGAVVLPTEAIAVETRPSTRPDRFSRLFNNLRPFAEASSSVTRALRELGEPGGIMDAKDPLHEGPVRLVTNPELSPNNRDNPAHTAGTTFLGQFLDHDMTFDTSSRLGVPTRPERSPNARTPTFDLDTVYGGGPTSSPQLYQSRDRAKFRIEAGGLFEDLPRAGDDGTAIIGDPRNDENMMIAGLQAAFLCFHNKVVDQLRSDKDFNRAARAEHASLADGDAEAQSAFTADAVSGSSTFNDARRIVTWHYQWIILNEFLPQILGRSVVNDALSERRFYTPRAGEQSIPVEFQLIYRFGHSLVRPSYRANLNGDNDLAFFGFIFDERTPAPAADPPDLRGGFRAPRRFIGWQTFFDFGDAPRPRPVGGSMGPMSQDVRPNKVIDTKISTPLFQLPLGAIASGDQPTSLPQRNLLRHLTWSVPSGQAVAEAMRIPVLSRSQLSDLGKFGVGLDRSTPLWFYILREAEIMGKGNTLAGIGARICAEVFVGLLKLDPNSFLSRNSRWRPTLPSRAPGTFTMVDLLTYAGLDPGSRTQ
jgi:hypothetical protein